MANVERVSPIVSLRPTRVAPGKASVRKLRLHEARFRVEDGSIRLRSVEVESCFLWVTCCLRDERDGVVVVAEGRRRGVDQLANEVTEKERERKGRRTRRREYEILPRCAVVKEKREDRQSKAGKKRKVG